MTGSIRSAKPREGGTLRALAFLVAALFNLLLMLGAALYLLDDDDYRHVLVWSADYFLDSRLQIDGSFSIKFAAEVELNAEKLRLQANDGSYDLSLEKLYLQQRFTSYLGTGTFWINKLSADNLQVEIIASQSDEEFDWQQLSVLPVVIEETRIANLSLGYTDSEQRHVIELYDIVLDDENNQGPIKVSAAGVVDSRPLVFAGKLGSLAQLRGSEQNFPIEFSLRSAGDAAESAARHDKLVIELKGTVDRTRPGDSLVDASFDVDLAGLVPFFSQKVVAHRLGHLRGSLQAVNVHHDWGIKSIRFSATDTDLYRLKVDAALDKSKKLALLSEFEVPDPAAFGAQFGIDLGGYAAYRGKGNFSGNPSRINYQGKLSIGRITSEIGATVSLRGSRPSLQGKWNVRELYLADIGITTQLGEIIDPRIKANDSADVKPAGSATTGIAMAPGPGREIIDLDGLRKFDLELDVSIDRLVGADYALDRLAGKIRLTDGLLNIAPLRMTYQGGVADLELSLAARKTPALGVKIKAQNLMLDKLLDRMRAELQVKGKLDLQADVKSAGRSVDELLSAVTGNVSVSLDKANLPRQYLEYFSLVDRPPAGAHAAYTSVEIDGAISARIDKQLQLSAREVSLKTNDGNYQITLGKLDSRQSLTAYHETGTLLLHDLLLEDMHAEIAPVKTLPQVNRENTSPREEKWHEAESQGFDLPSLVVEKMQLSRLSLDYRKGDRQHTASLSNFAIDNDDSSKPMTLSAAGKIDEHTLRLVGTVGTAAQPRGEKRTYPIDFSLSRGTADVAPDKPVIKFSGSVDRRAAGGIQVDAKFNIVLSELATLIEQATSAEELGQLQGEINIAEVDGRWGIKKLQLSAIDTELYQLSVDGTVDDAYELELNSAFSIPDPAALGAQFGVDLTGYRPYHGKGVLSGTRSKLDYRGLVNIGRIQSETTLTVTRVKDKPFIRGKFTIANLYLPDIGLNFRMGEDPDAPKKASPDTSAKPQKEKPAPAVRQIQPIFSHEPFDFSGLQNFNLDLEVLIDQITGTDFAIDKLTGEIGLTDGVLRVSPMRLVLEGGETELDLVLDTRERPSATLTMMADHLLLGSLISQLQTEAPVKGEAHLKIDVKTNGDSAHEMASELSGDVGFGLENAQFPRSYLDFLSANVFGWMYGMVTYKDSHTQVDCLIMDFDVDQGVAKSNLLIADGPNVIIEGKASIDLGLETIEMVLLPKEKRTFHTSIASAEITGPLRDPDVHTSTGKAAAIGIGGLVLVPEVFVPLALVDMLWKQLVHSNKDGGGCTEFATRYRETQQKADGTANQ